MNVITASARKL